MRSTSRSSSRAMLTTHQPCRFSAKCFRRNVCCLAFRLTARIGSWSAPHPPRLFLPGRATRSISSRQPSACPAENSSFGLMLGDRHRRYDAFAPALTIHRQTVFIPTPHSASSCRPSPKPTRRQLAARRAPLGWSAKARETARRRARPTSCPYAVGFDKQREAHTPGLKSSGDTLPLGA